MRYLFGPLSVVAGLVVAFSALVVGGIACDEGCGAGPSWTNSEHSWQWDVIPVLGVSIFAAACVLFVLVAKSQTTYSIAALGTQSALAGLLLLVVAGSTFSGPYVALGVFAPVLLGAAAAACIPTKD